MTDQFDVIPLYRDFRGHDPCVDAQPKTRCRIVERCVLSRGGAEDAEMVRPLHPHAFPSGRRDGRATRTRYGTTPRPPRLRATHLSIAISAVTTWASRRNLRRGVGSWKGCVLARGGAEDAEMVRPLHPHASPSGRRDGRATLTRYGTPPRPPRLCAHHLYRFHEHPRRGTAGPPAIGPDAAVRSSRTGRRRRGSPAGRRRPPRARSCGPARDRARSRRYRGYATFPAG